MKFIKVKLKDICTPKQWKNLPISALHENGKYKVYGANGVIGYYNEYNHEFPTLAITCRGATCGNVHITEPKSYITSNAMSLDDLDILKVDLKFLKYVLLKRGFYDVITGSAQPQITATNLNKIDLLIPEKLDDQQKIAELLNQIEELINKREESIKLLDELTKSTFLDMFGDLNINNYNWKSISFESIILDVKNGITRRGKQNKGDVVLKLKDIRINFIDYENVNRIELTQSEKDKFSVTENNLLFIRVNGNPNYVGRCAVFNGYSEPVYYNDHIMRIEVNNDFNSIFLSYLINSHYGKYEIKKYIKTSAGQYTINQEGLGKIKLFQIPKPLQDKFAEIVIQIEQTKTIYQNSLTELNNLFGSIAQKAFKGELDVSKTELIQKEQEEITMAIKLDEKKLLEEIRKGNFILDEYLNPNKKKIDELRILQRDLLEQNKLQQVDEIAKHILKLEKDLNNSKDDYEKIKKLIFKLIEDGKISQRFDDNSKKIILEVK